MLAKTEAFFPQISILSMFTMGDLGPPHGHKMTIIAPNTHNRVSGRKGTRPNTYFFHRRVDALFPGISLVRSG